MTNESRTFLAIQITTRGVFTSPFQGKHEITLHSTISVDDQIFSLRNSFGCFFDEVVDHANRLCGIEVYLANDLRVPIGFEWVINLQVRNEMEFSVCLRSCNDRQRYGNLEAAIAIWQTERGDDWLLLFEPDDIFRTEIMQLGTDFIFPASQ